MQKIQSEHTGQHMHYHDDHRLSFVDTDKAWRELHDRLHNDGLLPVAPVPAHRTLVPVWTRWAAAILVLITSGIIMYPAWQKHKAGQYMMLASAGDNATMVHMLDDGTVVYLAENTTLKVPLTFDERSRTVSLNGEAFFDIEHDPKRPFVVEAQQVSIQVLGTAFNVRATSHEAFELFVERGLVRASLKETSEVSVDAGQGELIRVSNNSLSKTRDNDFSKSAWKIQRMHFKDEPLGNILSVINRNYHTNIYLQQAELEARKMTVTFYNNNIQTIIELICLSMNLEAEYASSSEVMLKSTL